jgi:Fe-S-cluster-containing hydrogenase component 2
VVIPRNCVGCRTCEVSCSFYHSPAGEFAKSRIRVHAAAEKRHVQMTCLQCIDAACARACPVEALKRNEATGAVEIDAGLCVGCAVCAAACPFGHMRFDEAVKKPFKCDLCGGSPRCAQFCPNKALEMR